MITNLKGNFLLIDNASFHRVDESIKELMIEKRIAFTRARPMGYLFDPIEEFFANSYKIQQKKIKNMVAKSEVLLEQETFIELIHEFKANFPSIRHNGSIKKF